MADTGDPDQREPNKELLHQALELPPAERSAFIASRMPLGPERDEAIALLEEVEGLDGFLEQPLHGAAEVYRPPLPERIAGYAIESVLGWGSMGVVYLARQVDPARLVALKVLRVDSAGPETADRFQREVQLLAKLTHPGIATIYEAGVADLGGGHQPWFTMEYVDGAALDSHAKAAGLDRRARVELIVQAARALQHAHDIGIVHRDLKPANVLVRGDGSVRVVDFGVAHSRDEDAAFLTLTATGQVIGTLAYMAPEQAHGAVVEAAADQFALGAMLYELLTDELPLPVRGRLPHEALRAVSDCTWTPPSRHEPGLAGDIEAILATALAPEPNRRYPGIGAFADDLERWLAGKPIVARAPSRFSGARRFVRRNPLLIGATAVVLVLLGAALAVTVQASLDGRRESEVAGLMSDLALINKLERRVDDLWPAHAAMLPELDDWIASARGLSSRLDRHRAEYAGLTRAGGASRTAVETELGSAWLVELSRELIEMIEALVAPGGLLEAMESRRVAAAQLRTHTIDLHAHAWTQAIARVSGDARFDGLTLVPQEGLVPLGADPVSGLEEFGMYASGTIPGRGSEGGRVVPVVGDALTLVLIPGGTFWIGGQKLDAAAPNHVGDVPLYGHEGPPFELRLDPFLISKFELTQDQWVRLVGVNPSDWEVGSEFSGVTIGPLHPVEGLSWERALEVLPRFCMTLPTEAQWEVAARGGSPWARIFGPTLVDCIEYVNWNSHHRDRFEPGQDVPDDGYATHRPVGDLGANGYGLHDVLGNVWEYCRDTYKVDYHKLDHADGDGLVITVPDGDVARRGGGSALPAPATAVYARGDKRFDGRDALTGLRPVWPLQR